MTDLQFTVRPLPSTGLEGAFRVHIDQGALTKLGLKLEDTCRITSEDGSSGLGIAWRAADKMGNNPKMQPVKLSETLRETFGFKLGTHVKIEKSERAIAPAAKVALTDITPSDYDGTDDGQWYNRCRAWLYRDKCEAFAIGMTFDVAAKKGLKKRYFVEHVAPQANACSTGGPSLFYIDNDTEITFVQGSVQPQESEASDDLDLRLDLTRIGGLKLQLESLNKRLVLLCEKAKRQNVRSTYPWNAGILLHGYEGTGKTLVLDELAAKFGRTRTTRLGKQQLLGTASKNDTLIKSSFCDALTNQPSLIIIDNLDEIASANDPIQKPTIRSLEAAFDSIYGSGVLVVGATRSPSTIDSALIARKRFEKLYELPVPDAAARVQIVRLLLDNPPDDHVCTNIGARTHGFTAKDLSLLCGAAMNNALERCVDGTFEKPSARPSISGETLTDGTNDTNPSPTDTETTAVEKTESFDPPITLLDFDSALAEVRPTALREIILETPKVTWNDIGGSDTVKAHFDKIIGWPIQHSDTLARLGRANWQKSVLLYGPPGCSKTMTAQAVANTYGLNFIAVKGAELISMYVGESERAVREVFRKAKAAAPSIIFFDEIDSVGSDRDAGGNSGLHVLTTLLNEMDGFEKLKGVQVIAATNKPASLDPALLRPGRFDAHIYLGPPSLNARRDIIGIQLKALQLHSDLDLENVAKETEGYSGAEVVGICDAAVEAVIERAISHGDEKVTKADFEAAMAGTARGISEEMLEGYRAFAGRAGK